eukprot:254747_1
MEEWLDSIALGIYSDQFESINIEDLHLLCSTEEVDEFVDSNLNITNIIHRKKFKREIKLKLKLTVPAPTVPAPGVTKYTNKEWFLRFQETKYALSKDNGDPFCKLCGTANQQPCVSIPSLVRTTSVQRPWAYAYIRNTHMKKNDLHQKIHDAVSDPTITKSDLRALDVDSEIPTFKKSDLDKGKRYNKMKQKQEAQKSEMQKEITAATKQFNEEFAAPNIVDTVFKPNSNNSATIATVEHVDDVSTEPTQPLDEEFDINELQNVVNDVFTSNSNNNNKKEASDDSRTHHMIDISPVKETPIKSNQTRPPNIKSPSSVQGCTVSANVMSKKRNDLIFKPDPQIEFTPEEQSEILNDRNTVRRKYKLSEMQQTMMTIQRRMNDDDNPKEEEEDKTKTTAENDDDNPKEEEEEKTETTTAENDDDDKPKEEEEKAVGIFDNKTFVIAGRLLQSHKSLTNTIETNGGAVVQEVNSSVHGVIVHGKEGKVRWQEQKIKHAKKYKIHVLSEKFITDSVECGKLLSMSDAKYCYKRGEKRDLENKRLLQPRQSKKRRTK